MAVLAVLPGVRTETREHEALEDGWIQTRRDRPERSLTRQRLHDQVRWTGDGVRRTWGLTPAGWGNGEDVELAGHCVGPITQGDGVEMVVVVPEDLGDGLGNHEICVVSDGIGSVEVKHLQALHAAHRQQLSGG